VITDSAIFAMISRVNMVINYNSFLRRVSCLVLFLQKSSLIMICEGNIEKSHFLVLSLAIPVSLHSLKYMLR
jgi:hypothetical protein